MKRTELPSKAARDEVLSIPLLVPISPHAITPAAAPDAASLEILDPDLAAAHAADWSTKLKGRAVPLRRQFLRRTDQDPSPLARMIGGGRGADTRIKLYLSLLWVSVAPPHDSEYPARAWAEMLCPGTRATLAIRRIQAAMSWLEREGFIRLEKRAGYPARIFINDDGGAAVAYRLPWGEGKANYVKIGAEIWEGRWISTLRTPGLAMLLVLLDLQKYKDPGSPVWLAPSLKSKTYGLSGDIWTRGISELKDHGIVTVVPRGVSPGAFGFKRVRHTYELHAIRLSTQP